MKNHKVNLSDNSHLCYYILIDIETSERCKS